MRIGVVLAGGDTATQLVPPVLADEAVMADAFVVAADSGLDLAERLGITPSLVIGDFDSVTPAALARARTAGIRVVEYSTAKDETDLDLALDALAREGEGVDRIVMIGGGGGRLDHLLANIGAVARRRGVVPTEAWLGEQFLVVVHDEWRAVLRSGATFSVLAWGGPVVVSVAGVRWPLDRHLLEVGSTLGISNEALADGVEISVHEGRAIVILPNAKDLS